jgi:hypothetical protein
MESGNNTEYKVKKKMKQKSKVTILSIHELLVANKIDEEYDVGTSNDISVGRIGGAHLNIVRIRVDITDADSLLSEAHI